MIRKSVNPFSASITMGLERGYSRELIHKSDVISWLQGWQDRLLKEKKVGLSVCISECEIIFSGQVEPHLKLSMINYPKFPLKEEDLKDVIELLVRDLMEAFNQNRIVIEYLDETIMLENSPDIDPRIKES
ncbi:hypothetical protein [Marinilabilia salmonicolor]|uniref:hypothetical protein n=1 Tax=Marinilabilia salmonicolor TaxID=989 RepID=UPI000299E550|nr:hypothetical protein [Marinilabilia salmonicolor]